MPDAEWLESPSSVINPGFVYGGNLGPSFDEDFHTSVGRFTFTGSAHRFVLDNENTWQPMLVDMPGFQGARAVINWAINSDTAGTWSIGLDSGGSYSALWTTDNNGVNVSALREINGGVTSFGPYIYGYNGYYHSAGSSTAPPGLIPAGTVFAAAFEAASISGGTSANIYQRNRDSNFAPTESSNGPIALTTAFQRFSSTFEQNAAYQAFGFRVHPFPAAVAALDVVRPMLEDVTGRKGSLIPSEYIPAGTTPGWKWFDTARPTVRTNPALVASHAAMTAQKDPVNTLAIAGVVNELASTALTSIKGLVSEPASTNLCQGWNVPLNAGWAKTSGAITGFTGRPGILAGDSTAYAEASSGMLIAASDITLTPGTNVISSSTTSFTAGGINTFDTYWVWTGTATYGPLKFSSIGANAVTSSVALASFASGTTVRIMRCPASGDTLLLELNDGTYHTTTASGAVTLPANTGTWDAKAPVAVPLAAVPPVSGSYAGSDNGRKIYFCSVNCAEFGWAIASGTGTIRLVYDRASLVQAAEGLGYISPGGLVYALAGAASGATIYDLGITGNGTASRNTAVSAYVRRIGSGACTIVLKSHTGSVAFTNTTWQRVAWFGTSVNTDSRISIAVSANTTVYLVLGQVEQAGSGSTALVSSPILTRGVAATRATTRLSASFAQARKNNITRRITWTPAFGPLAQKQTLWALYQDASNLLELSITNTTVTWRKRRDGVNYDVTSSYTPVAGTPVEFVAAISAATGVTLSVGGAAATPNTTDFADIYALTPAAIEDIGSSQGATAAYGAFKALKTT